MPPPDGPRPTVVGPDSGPESPFPLRLDGKVIKGFGRGSSELGIPTANIPISGLSVGGHTSIESGVYYGFAGLSPSRATHQHPPGSTSKYHLMAHHIFSALLTAMFGPGDTDPEHHEKNTFTSEKGAVYPMVMSIGWNPFYKNTVRSVEVHIMHGFEEEFYDSHMNLVVLGFIRPEYDYVSKESLIEDIKTDIDVAGRSLARKEYAKYSKEKGLLDFSGKSEVAS
ncbi:riboflavin kinase [Extremus antarcticus]|uniref:Riboflavin kinase n=1 Tax=Extremus antarcticus TaxID=702011 RepID=A0AAJ0DKN4_9PEZI|nr:riboflavin kinase [Extremus antarcticus]